MKLWQTLKKRLGVLQKRLDSFKLWLCRHERWLCCFSRLGMINHSELANAAAAAGNTRRFLLLHRLGGYAVGNWKLYGETAAKHGQTRAYRLIDRLHGVMDGYYDSHLWLANVHQHGETLAVIERIRDRRLSELAAEEAAYAMAAGNSAVYLSQA